MALIAPLLIMLLFGVLEIGLIIKDLIGINQAAREGARVAAVGATLATIDARIDGSAPTIDTAALTWEGSWRVLSGGTWGSWTTLADTGTGADLRNNAPVGAQVRIAANYPHQLVCGQLFSRISDDGASGVVTLRASLIMRRE